jgi:glycosyltransferase involved in cell wall biosynthesis
MKFSIIVCTYNRIQYLPTCLNKIINQNFQPYDFELIIVNNNSDDSTEDFCTQFVKENKKKNIHYFNELKRGLSNARNLGIAKSIGDIICFIDDDGYIKNDFLTNLDKIVSDPKYKSYIAFGGKVTPWYNAGSEPNWLSKPIEGVVSKVDLGEKIKDFDKKYPAGCNMIFRRSFFDKYGGFNPDLHTRGDDKFVFYKLKKNGEKVLYVPSINVDHYIDDYRIEKKFIIKLSKSIGESERIRKQGDFGDLLLTFFEYTIKFFVSIGIATYYAITNRFPKAHYLLLIRFYILVGFFKP